MSKKLWLEFFKPRFTALFERVKGAGKYVILHTCGNNEEILVDLIEMGLDCYQTFQPEVYDIERIKKEYGKDLSFWGGISTQVLLPYGTPEEVEKETIRTMRMLGKNGGYIAAPTHSIPGGVPVENILAMLKVFDNQ